MYRFRPAFSVGPAARPAAPSHERVRLPGPHEAKSHDDGAVPLVSNRPDRSLVLFHDLGRRYDRDALVGSRTERRTDSVRVADQGHVEATGPLPNRRQGTLHRHSRRSVSSHRVQRDANHVSSARPETASELFGANDLPLAVMATRGAHAMRTPRILT